MLLPIFYLMVISCNIFGVATSPNIADQYTSFFFFFFFCNGNFNGMNLNMWSCLSSFGMVFVGFEEHLTSTI